MQVWGAHGREMSTETPAPCVGSEAVLGSRAVELLEARMMYGTRKRGQSDSFPYPQQKVKVLRRCSEVIHV